MFPVHLPPCSVVIANNLLANGHGVSSETFVPGARVRAYEGLGRSEVVQVFKNGNDIVGVAENGTEFKDDQALVPYIYSFNCLSRNMKM